MKYVINEQYFHIFVFLLGEPGIGKTSALASTALEWARGTGMKCQRLVKDFFPKNLNLSSPLINH